MKFTIFGGRGFVGGALRQRLLAGGHEVHVPVRGEIPPSDIDLGHVVYAIGLTADFRSRPFDTVEAHVGLLGRLLKHARYTSWLYLSSTRVYAESTQPLAREDDVLHVRPTADGLYNLSKLTGEALCLAQAQTSVRVARLSNVYGVGQSQDNFLGSLLHDIARHGRAEIREAESSSKDYVALDDACTLIERIAVGGRQRLYNVASGVALTHLELAEGLRRAYSCDVDFLPGAPRRTFPAIDISRAAGEFGHRPRLLLNDLRSLAPSHPSPDTPEE